MFRMFAAALSVFILLSSAAHSEKRQKLGYGRLITNDVLFDQQDRWRTGSIASSWVWGQPWKGHRPVRFGELLELRVGGEILAPEDLQTPAAGDRPYASALSIGLHTHYRVRQTDFSVGGDLVVTGPITGLDGLQNELHDLLGGAQVSDLVQAAQIGNGAHPTLVFEAARNYALGERVSLRPFFEGRAGIETLARVGADLTVGHFGIGELLVRDSTTGQRYRVIRDPNKGYSLTLGADIAYVEDSAFLPESRGYQLSDDRKRVRAGLHWQGESASAFYGVTWLSEEFVGQRESQIVGSIRLQLSF